MRPAKRLPICQRDLSMRGMGRLIAHRRIEDQVDAWCRLSAAQYCYTKMPVFDQMSHRAILDLAVIKMRKKRRCAFSRTAVADLDVQDGLCIRREIRPQAHGIEHAPRAQRQGIGASVEVRV